MKALAAAFAVLALAAPAAAAARCDPADLEARLMCPTCEGQTVEESSAPAAADIRAYIRRRSAAGASCSAIESSLVMQFGEGIRAAPEKRGFGLLAWILPPALLGVGAVVVGVLAWRWSRRRPAAALVSPELNGRGALDPDLERRLDEELARFE